MPFPKDARSAADVAKEEMGEPLVNYDGIDLLLKSFSTEDSAKFGQLSILECETEDGTPVRISSFSGVIANQLSRVAGKLPLLIKPTKNGNYFTIY